MNLKNKMGKAIYNYFQSNGLLIITKEEKIRLEGITKSMEIEILELRGLAHHKKTCVTVKFVDNGSIHHKCDCGYQEYFNTHK